MLKVFAHWFYYGSHCQSIFNPTVLSKDKCKLLVTCCYHGEWMGPFPLHSALFGVTRLNRLSEAQPQHMCTLSCNQAQVEISGSLCVCVCVCLTALSMCVSSVFVVLSFKGEQSGYGALIISMCLILNVVNVDQRNEQLSQCSDIII